LTTVAALAVVASSPALANYPPPTLRQLCTAAANNGTLEPTPLPQVCVLPPGQTTAPNNYSATIAVRKTGAAATITFTVTAGSLPPGLTMPRSAPSTTSPAITGIPTRAGTFNFTIKAAAGGLTYTLAYQITITVHGLPDQLQCNPATNGGFLQSSGVCWLPDAILGLPYSSKLFTSHQAGGTLSLVAGKLPPGMSLPASFTGSADVVSGSPTVAGVAAGNGFTVKGTGDQGQPLYQAYYIEVEPENQPLTVNNGPDISPGFAGQAGYEALFFVVGGAAPYTWSLVAGQFPPGLSLTTFSDPRDANDELAGTPTTLGTYNFTMRVTDFNGQQATAQFTVQVLPVLQVPNTTLPSGTVGVPYSIDLDNIAQGGLPPYGWSIFSYTQLPPGLSFDTTATDVLDGTPTRAGTFSMPMLVTDHFDNNVDATLTITINP
jgi:hypothetical protein